MYTIKEMYDLDHTAAKEYLEQFTYPWEALKGIKDFIISLGKTLSPEEYTEVSENVWVHKTAKVFPSAYLGAPCIIGAETEVRHCAFVRGSALVGNSILGYYSHMGAGSITSNVKSDKTLVVVHGEKEMETGLKKFGAMLGDRVEVGCNSVLNPGSVIGPNSRIYPVSCVRGVVPANSIHKNTGEIMAQK